jgi:DNA-3-methyladenine glycosylase II
MEKVFKYKTVNVIHLNELAKIIPTLPQMIDFKKPFSIRIMPDHFQCFVHTIISQQLSSAAVDTIWNKLFLNLKKINPKTIANTSKEILSSFGLSPQKISLIKQLAYDIVDKKINLKKLNKKSNEEISETLMQYKYVGQ